MIYVKSVSKSEPIANLYPMKITKHIASVLDISNIMNNNLPNIYFGAVNKITIPSINIDDSQIIIPIGFGTIGVKQNDGPQADVIIGSPSYQSYYQNYIWPIYVEGNSDGTSTAFEWISFSYILISNYV